jgi:hypothetical protein
MVFKKQEEKAPGDSSGKIPRALRYDCMARISIEGCEGEAVMRNVSPGGFRMESRAHTTIAVHTRCSLRIDPEDGSGIGSFDLEAEVRWIRTNEDGLSAGFLVTGKVADGSLADGSLAADSFESYVEYRKQSS